MTAEVRLAPVLVVACAWACALAAACSASSSRGELGGPTPRTVRLGGTALAGATITAGARSTVAGADGRFALDVDEGAQLVVATGAGRHAALAAVVAAPPETRVDLALDPSADSVEVAFTGDVAFPRDSDPAARLAAVAPLLSSADVAVVPLESVLGDGEAAPHPSRGELRVSPISTARALAAAGAGVVVLANDHAYDFLDDGTIDTVDALRAAGLTTVGAGADETEAYATQVISRNGVRLGIAAFSGLTGRGEEGGVLEPPFFDATASKGGVARTDVRRIDAALATLRGSADRIVVVLHGGRAHDATPANAVATAARRAIDGGADVVVAHHTRSLGGIEVYKGKLVVYGLGPLSFPDLHGDGARGAVLRVRLARDGSTAARLDPIVIDDGAPAAAAGASRAATLDLLAARSAPLGVTVTPDGRVLPASPDTLPVTYDDGSGAVAAEASQGALRSFAGEVGGARSLASVAVLSPGGSTLWLGTELLAGGELDDEVADGRFGAPVGWRFPSDAEQIVAAPDGGLELAICRSGTARDVASATSRARYALPAGGGVSLCGCWRGDGGALGGAALAFYDSLDDDARPLETRDLLTGPSPAAEACFCRAAAPPRDARFAAVRLSHTPSASGNACVRFDRLRLIGWEPQSSLRVDLRVPNRVTHVLVTGVGGAAQAQLAWSVATLELP